MLLNNREGKDFEVIYQWLSNFPGWKMEDIFADETPEHRELDTGS
jgi:hypothetical protein